jgi:hypothetical protein
VSTRPKLFEHFGSINQAAGCYVSVRVPQGLMKGRSVGVVEPITGVQRQEFDDGSLRQIRWFVNDESTGAHASLEGHGIRLSPGGPPNNRLQPTAAGAIMSRG